MRYVCAGYASACAGSRVGLRIALHCSKALEALEARAWGARPAGMPLEPDDVARAVHSAYASLPKTGKPQAEEWTVLSGFVLARPGAAASCRPARGALEALRASGGRGAGAPAHPAPSVHVGLAGEQRPDLGGVAILAREVQLRPRHAHRKPTCDEVHRPRVGRHARGAPHTRQATRAPRLAAVQPSAVAASQTMVLHTFII